MIYNWSMHRKLNFSSSLLKFFSYHRAKENVSYFFCAWSSDHGLWVKNDLQWKTFQMIYNMTLPGKNIFSYLPVMTSWLWYLIFSTFWSHIFLLKIGQYTKSNLMVYNFSMFRKIIFDDRELWCHRYLQPWEKCLRKALVFLWNSALRENFYFYFSAAFC